MYAWDTYIICVDIPISICMRRDFFHQASIRCSVERIRSQKMPRLLLLKQIRQEGNKDLPLS